MEPLGVDVQTGGEFSASPRSEGLRPGRDGFGLAFSGQLHNRAELWAALRNAGAIREGESCSDLELVESAHQAWGPSCVERFEGDFAFVVQDPATRRIFAATDPIGVKPLYYRVDGRRFAAASSPGALLASDTGVVPCEEKVAAYLSLAPHLGGGPWTFYRDIQRLEGGCRLEVGPEGCKVTRYWELDPARQNEERGEEAHAERLRWLLEDSVRRRAAPEPPFACALSGGFDSSCVAGLYRRVLEARGIEAPLQTFSFELRDDDADESEIIDAVAKAVNANHHHVFVDHDDAFEVLPEIVRALHAPAPDIGMLLLWRKKQEAARAGVTTILSGLGGDEIFLGRLQHLADLLRAGRLPSFAREFRGLHPIHRSTGQRTSVAQLLKDYTVLPLLPRPLKKLLRRTLFGERPVGPWIHPDLARRTRLAERIREGSRRTYRDCYRQDCWETFTYELLGEALPAHAALGAAVGVETRFPILDRRVVEFMFAAPREYKVREGHSRILQRRAMADVLPEVVVKEHRKKDFHPALARQQRANFVRAFEQLMRRRELLSDSYVDWSHLRSTYRSYIDRGIKGWFPLLYAMNLELWLQGLQRTPSRIEARQACAPRNG